VDHRLGRLARSARRGLRAFRKRQELDRACRPLQRPVERQASCIPIDEASPLHGLDSDTLAQSDVLLFLTIEAHDQAIAAVVHDMKHYDIAHIRFGMRYADAVLMDRAGNATADLSRISLLEPDTGLVPEWTRWAR